MSYKKMLPLVLAALLLWTVPASAAPETTLKVALGDPEDSEMGVVGHAFKKYVEEKTGGKVEVQCFYGGSRGDVEILLVDDADDVVHGVVIDGQAGIAGFCEGLRKLFQRNIVLHGHHVYAGRQDLLHLHVVELDGAADELAFPVGHNYLHE